MKKTSYQIGCLYGVTQDKLHTMPTAFTHMYILTIFNP